MSTTDFEALIPEMRDWNNGAGIDIETWIACSGNFRLAVGYSTIFWPQFFEVDGYILRERCSGDSLGQINQQCSGGRPGVEALLNHLHIADIQYHGCEDATRERLVHLGRVLREIYEAKLAWQFPGRKFEVCFDESEKGDLINYQITFFQVP